MTYFVGSNAPGFLPDAELIECETFEDAKSELISELEATAGAFGGDGEPLDAARNEASDADELPVNIKLCGLVHWIIADA